MGVYNRNDPAPTRYPRPCAKTLVISPPLSLSLSKEEASRDESTDAGGKSVLQFCCVPSNRVGRAVVLVPLPHASERGVGDVRAGVTGATCLAHVSWYGGKRLIVE